MESTLKSIRRDAGMTQDQTAKLIGISQDLLSRAELGERNLSPENLRKLAEVYLKAHADKASSALEAGSLKDALKSLQGYARTAQGAPLGNEVKAEIVKELSALTDEISKVIKRKETTEENRSTMKALGRDSLGMKINKED